MDNAEQTPDASAGRAAGGPKFIAVINTKGGVGKTTLSVHVATGLAMQDKKVLLVDADSQRSSYLWMERRTAAGIAPEFTCMSCTGPDIASQDARDVYEDFEYIVFDTPSSARENVSLQLAAGCAHVALVPLKRSPLELDALGDIIPQLGKLGQKNRRLRFFGVQWGVDPRRSGNEEFGQQLEEQYKLPVAKTWITNRYHYVTVMETGGTVLDSGKDTKAREQISELLAEINQRLDYEHKEWLQRYRPDLANDTAEAKPAGTVVMVGPGAQRAAADTEGTNA